MVKMVILVKRRDGLTHEEFVDYWLSEHVELGKQFPNLERYATLVPRDPEKSEYDGIAELTFESSEGMVEAFDSEIGQANVDDAENFIDLDAMETIVTEEHVQFEA